MKKRLLVLLVLSASAAGCGGAASQSGVWEHDTLYRDLDHMRFSWGGHKSVSSEEVRKSMEEGWWGKEVEVPVVPGK
jgi:hypothetical protein